MYLENWVGNDYFLSFSEIVLSATFNHTLK